MAEGMEGPGHENLPLMDALKNERKPCGFRSSQRCALLLTFP